MIHRKKNKKNPAEYLGSSKSEKIWHILTETVFGLKLRLKNDIRIIMTAVCLIFNPIILCSNFFGQTSKMWDLRIVPYFFLESKIDGDWFT